MNNRIGTIGGDGGIWWPLGDKIGYKTIKAELARLPEAMAFCHRRHVAVQAGGNCGLVPIYLAGLFETVYTFEPEPLNFHCLVRNCEDHKNVIKMQAAVGDGESVTIALDGFPENNGAYRVSIDKHGNIPCLTVDSLRLTDCDLIMLDVEGMEYHALDGADNTIEEYKPVIIIELTGHSGRYGHTPSAIVNWLKERGYTEVLRLERDSVFIYEGT